VLDWPKRSEAERLRQWPLIVHAAERVLRMPELDGLLLLGSFAAGRADQISDVDLVAVVAAGQFDDAWARRRELETPGTLHEWFPKSRPSTESYVKHCDVRLPATSAHKPSGLTGSTGQGR
jgi:hypothetical protein